MWCVFEFLLNYTKRQCSLWLQKMMWNLCFVLPWNVKMWEFVSWWLNANVNLIRMFVFQAFYKLWFRRWSLQFRIILNIYKSWCGRIVIISLNRAFIDSSLNSIFYNDSKIKLIKTIWNTDLRTKHCNFFLN